ncbi:DNA replication/repair protein RecF [Phormidium yuhuli AB48]|uniref:DNA replication and repair protein RecF n=1 Tax=Phormidium yuhuli AB48 TaxID=2940671 RepID=A0ABY5AW87_9CYAN|nr:DNA replication/repair protein RecF [Phormidium yuhuli]USR93067.1 DNA replication/repair protein RecF [Phormidium yuhuli AB48]
MYLKSLNLQAFRNYTAQTVHLTAPKTILVGNNAQGKSNLLESVALLSTLKSQRASSDRELVQNEAAMGQIRGDLERITGEIELEIRLRRSGRRTVLVDRQACRRQVDFLGLLNVVEFSSLDLDLVRGSPDDRRRWLDGLVIQLEPLYAHLLKDYSQILRHRNALLKQYRGRSQASDEAMRSVLDIQLATAGARVMRRRWRAIQRIAPLAQRWHQEISGQTEYLSVDYAPQVRDIPDFNDAEAVRQAVLHQLRDRHPAERHQGTTLTGPHRDEVMLSINQTPARRYGSQGQQRTLVLALKLSELQLIEAVVGEPPVLLLDDVLAELDLQRQNQLLETIEDRFQTLISTTHLGAFDAQWLKSSQVLRVCSGKIETPETVHPTLGAS